MNKPLTPSDIRQAKLNNTDKRDRDLASSLAISEAELVAAQTGYGAVRISANPDEVMPLLTSLGEIMALTRNESCVHERVGTFEEYHSGKHASMVLGPEIDTRIFPKHWAFGFALEAETAKGPRRSLQFFDTSGTALQKIYLRDTSNLEAWAPLVQKLKLDDQSQSIETTPAPTSTPAKLNDENRDKLIERWARLTDTHQFGLIIKKLGMNRLGSYRHADGERWVRRVENDCVEGFLNTVSAHKQKVIFFVSNTGNIQIHWGTLDTIKVMGPWLNVMDERFNLHLRGDHISEVYVIEKPTKRGPAISLEAFDENGGLIFQCFGQRDKEESLGAWPEILAELPSYTGDKS